MEANPFSLVPNEQGATSGPGPNKAESVVPKNVAQMFSEDAGPSELPTSGLIRAVPTGSTLNESVWETLKRDLRQIAINIRLVLMPVSKQETAKRALRDWDLWGPMLFSIALALLLSAHSDSPSKAFSIVFVVLTIGAAVLTLNVILLGGKIVFFQSCSLLGYCTFPLLVAALAISPFKVKIVRLLGMLLGVAWSSWAAVPFISASVSPQRKALAVYPMMLMYLFLSWFSLIST